MLGKLRKRKIKKAIWIVLAVLILPAFIFWGSSSLIRSKEEPLYAGKISGKEVSFSDFKEALDATRNQIIMQFGDNYAEAQKSLDLEELAWGRLILLSEARKQGISATDKEVVEAIANYPIFSGRAGFEERVYSQMLQYVFRTPARTFEEQVRQGLILAKLYQKVSEGVGLSDEEIMREYRRLNEQISVYYIAALPSAFAKEISPGEDELKFYFAKNQIRFRQPPSFNIEYITWSEEEENLQEIQNKAEMLLLKKADFAEKAKDYGFNLNETGFFAQNDPIPAIGWSPEIMALLEKGKAGELLPVVRLGKKYYIINLKDKRETYIPDFAQIKDKIKESFINDNAVEAARNALEECLKSLNAAPEPKELQDAADKFNLSYGSTGFFIYGSYIENIGISDIFWDKAADLENGRHSLILEMPSGLYVVKLKEKLGLDQEKYKEEKEGFGRKLLTEKKEGYFSNFFENLKTKASRF